MFSLRRARKVDERPAPVTTFDLVGAEKAFLSLHQVQLTGSSLCVRKSGRFIPLTDDVISKFMRSHMILTGQMKFWGRGTLDDFTAFIKAGL
jgi:hypothetical protein